MRMHFHMAGIYYQPLVIRCINELFKDLLPDPFIPLSDKSPVRIAPSSILRRQIPPGSSCSYNPEDRIDEPAIIMRPSSPNSFSTR